MSSTTTSAPIFEAPGRIDPETTAGTYTVAPATKKRTGVIPMAADAMFDIRVAGQKKAQKVTCKDRELFPDAHGFLFCQHVDCRDQTFADLKALKTAHTKTANEMKAGEEVHLYGFWSTDRTGVADEKCAGCKKATAEARKVEGAAADVVKACAEHAGGVIGLLTPGEIAS